VYDCNQEGGIARLLLMLMVAVLCAAQAAQAAAPRDALATLPTLRSETSIETFDASENGVRRRSDETLNTHWDMLWAPPRVRLLQGDIGVRLSYATDVQDQTQYPRGAGGSSTVRDVFDLQLDLATGPVAMRHHLLRSDTRYPGAGGRQSLQTQQLALSQVSYRLPFGVTTQLSDNSTLSYSGPGSVLGRGTEQQTTTALAEYEPPKVALQQRLRFETSKTTTRNPVAGTSTDGSSEIVEARRVVPLGHVGSLDWTYRSQHDSNSPSALGEGVAASTVQSTQRVRVSGAVRNSPLSYGADFLSATSSADLQPYRENTTTEVQLQFRPVSKNGLGSTLDFHSRQEQSKLRGSSPSDSNALHNWVVWGFRPHKRIDSKLQYHQYRTTDNLADLLTRDQDRLDANIGYNLPGSTGGRLDLHLWQDVSMGRQSGYSEEGLELRNRVVLGKAASVTFDYRAQLRDDSYVAHALSLTTERVATGISYEIVPGNGLTLVGRWAQAVELREGGSFRFDDDHVDLDLTWAPDWQWQYFLHIDGDTESTQDLVSGYRYANSDLVHAGVSFRF
jgi:hypothetical protein